MVEVIIYWVLWFLAACFNVVVLYLVLKMLFKPDYVNIKIQREDEWDVTDRS